MKTKLKLIVALIFSGVALCSRAEKVQSTWTISSETPVPKQFEIFRNPFFIGLDAPANRKIQIRVHEISPSGRPVASWSRTVKMPSTVAYGIDKWIRVKGLKTGIRYAVSFAPADDRPSISFLWVIRDEYNGQTGRFYIHHSYTPLTTSYPAPTNPGPGSANGVIIEALN